MLVLMKTVDVISSGPSDTGLSCVQDDSTTVAKVKAAFPENAIGSVIFYSSYNDTSPDGPPGTYTLSYACQYAYNPLIQLNPGITANPYNDANAADPRTNAVYPNMMNGQFGSKGKSLHPAFDCLNITGTQPCLCSQGCAFCKLWLSHAPLKALSVRVQTCRGVSRIAHNLVSGGFNALAVHPIPRTVL